jgi:hypothetical protein
MRGLLTVAFTVLFCLSGAASASAQSTAALGRRVVPRPPLVPIRSELLRPVGLTGLEDLRVRRGPASSIQRLSSAPNQPDRGRPARLCPMPVGLPDTTALDRMPVGRSDSARTAPMPVVAGCENPLFR